VLAVCELLIVDDIHINSKLTSGEDVADIGGTLLAYIAWKKQTEGQTLASATGYAGSALFVGMAQWLARTSGRKMNG